MNDNTLMPWGKYKGKKLANIPAQYFLWLLDKGIKDAGLKAYILDNLDGLRQEAGVKKSYAR